MAPIEEKNEDLEKYLLDIEVRGEVYKKRIRSFYFSLREVTSLLH